jgi:general stress protein YciG
MAGNKIGGQKSKITNLANNGEDFFSVIGAMGGRVKVDTKGFGADHERARLAGMKGGKNKRYNLTSKQHNYLVKAKAKGESYRAISEVLGVTPWVCRYRYIEYVQKSEN